MFKMNRRNPFAVYTRRATAARCMWALLLSALTIGAAGAPGQQRPVQPKQAGQTSLRLSEDQRILHVLNRLGFGARPGDLARIKQIGLEPYIEQQLHPEKIADTAAEAKLRDLPTLSMTTAELFAKYPNPGMLIRQLQRRGELPADLAALVEKRTKADTPAAATATNAPSADALPNTNGEEKMSATGESSVKENDAVKAGNNNEYRRVLRDYYAQNNLQLPQRITAELNASRILRSVYSERQLQEVMVDFWTNHFNVFVGKGPEKWLLVSYDRDTIRPHALDKFRDLLQATAESPAMLFYLDNFQSVSPNNRGERRRSEFGQRRRDMRERLEPESMQAQQPQRRPRRGSTKTTRVS